MAHVVILGSGVVGYATGVGMTSLGHSVTFADIREERLEELRDEGLTSVHAFDLRLDGVAAIFVAVPTPTGVNGIDVTFLESACESLGDHLRDTDSTPLIVFRSTMPPGTTRDVLIPVLEKESGKDAGVGFHVCYNPEYLREVNAAEDFLNFRILTFGTARPGDRASQLLKDLFAAWTDAAVTELTFEEAEFQKYVHNLWNAAKITFFNEMRYMAETLGVHRVDEIFALTTKTAEASWNPAYGTRDFGPYGGACLPKDTAAWSRFIHTKGVTPTMVDAMRHVNIGLGGTPC